MNTFTHDPDAVLDYVIDWSAWLGGDTISTFTVTRDPDATIVIDSSTNTPTAVTVWVSGGTHGEDSSITCHITTAGGRQDDRTIWLQVRQR